MEGKPLPYGRNFRQRKQTCGGSKPPPYGGKIHQTCGGAIHQACGGQKPNSGGPRPSPTVVTYHQLTAGVNPRPTVERSIEPAAGKCRNYGGSKPPPYGGAIHQIYGGKIHQTYGGAIHQTCDGDGYPVDYCERRLNFEQDSASGPAHVQ